VLIAISSPQAETVEEIKEKAFAHAGVVHVDLLRSLTEEQMVKLTRTLEANIQTV
jgi:hypothetical protein